MSFHIYKGTKTGYIEYAVFDDAFEKTCWLLTVISREDNLTRFINDFGTIASWFIDSDLPEGPGLHSDYHSLIEKKIHEDYTYFPRRAWTMSPNHGHFPILKDANYECSQIAAWLFSKKLLSTQDVSKLSTLME